MVKIIFNKSSINSSTPLKPFCRIIAVYNLGRKINGNYNIGNKNGNNIDNIGMTSNRVLYNNPPKKNNMIVNDDLDINNEQNKDLKENNI